MSEKKIQKLLNVVLQGKDVLVRHCFASLDSWLLGWLFKRLEQSFLIIASSPEQAQRIKRELEIFIAEDILLFPSLDYYQLGGCDASGERVGCLAKLAIVSKALLITDIRAIFQPTISPDELKQYVFCLELGSKINREDFIQKLLEAGYELVERVEEAGEVAVRGGIIDIFPPLFELPVRIELFGDEIESIRKFDPSTQKSQEKISSVKVYPARELILNQSTSQKLKKEIFKLAEELKKALPSSQKTNYLRSLQELTEQMEKRKPFYAQERFLSLSGKQAGLIEHLKENWTIFLADPLGCEQSISQWKEKSFERWSRLVAGGSIIPSPEKIFLAQDELEQKLLSFQLVLLGDYIKGGEEERELSLPKDYEEIDLAVEPNPDLRLQPSLSEPLSRLVKEIKKLTRDGFKIIISVGSRSQAERLAGLLRSQELYPAEISSPDEYYQPEFPLQIGIGELEAGFRLTELGLVIISEQEIFGEKIPRRAKARPAREWQEEDLSDLEPGEPVVHIQHGVGIYRGMKQVKVYSFEQWDVLKTRERPSITQPCLEIEYADGARLYLPVDEINQIQKYRAPTERFPRLDRLGGKSFALAKKKAEESIEKLAEELLELYASREVFQGYAFSPPDHIYREFESSFEYEETPDQLKAIEDVIADLTRSKPMDRLILGDVGYGKTEVAIRASFLVAMEGKQVAMLCPTTVLAQQHYDTFSKRLKGYPLEVRMLSRFQSKAEQKKIIEELKAGICDIVIGTHRLLSDDVEFKDLGLLIIDEEQRFGVLQKEKIKKLKKTVHCLTLTATPIPRTLQMTLLGLRDMSMINTPPPDRKEIHTELIHFDQELIREAILRELERGGQVFFVHNRVAGIDRIAQWLARLVPEARIAVAHGQMPERQLEEVMRDFYQHRYDVLVCTAIIESGLDLPRANTIIINRADQFGLAQLYQLRGRIGRSREKGYAYLVVPSKSDIRGDALKRLKALREFTQLGSGFRLAMYDLKIRGAGNLLGKEQTGHISRIGYELYLKLLERKIRQLKGEKIEEEFEPKLKLGIPAYLPDDYIPSDSERLGWYKRLAMAQDERELEELRDELLDRYGKIPAPAGNLLQAIKVKIWMRRLKIPELEAQDSIARIRFDEKSKVNFDMLFQLVQKAPQRFRFTRDERLIYQAKEQGKIFFELEEFFRSIRS